MNKRYQLIERAANLGVHIIDGSMNAEEARNEDNLHLLNPTEQEMHKILDKVETYQMAIDTIVYHKVVSTFPVRG